MGIPRWMLQYVETTRMHLGEEKSAVFSTQRLTNPQTSLDLTQGCLNKNGPVAY